eukprot:198560-Rhodomonas_salina.2
MVYMSWYQHSLRPYREHHSWYHISSGSSLACVSTGHRVAPGRLANRRVAHLRGLEVRAVSFSAPRSVTVKSRCEESL